MNGWKRLKIEIIQHAHNIFFLRIGIFMDTETLCLAEL